MNMVRIKERQERESVIVCRKNAFHAELAPLREQLLGGGGIVFTDSNVYALYRKELEKYLGGVPLFVMPAGEDHKNSETLFALLGAMQEAGLRRNSMLVALGGGVVGDVGGLAAGLYMRGIACVQVPTTLLAQTDSSVGGKTAVDFGGVKNLIGAFHQPSRVIVDPVFLKTLPRRELRCGLGEIVKHGALCTPIFEKLQANRENLFSLSFLAEIVPENIAFKASVVRQDPREKGLRKCLNLGHTTAHALELGGTALSHGECVLWGLLFEGKLAERHCHADGEFLNSLYALCRAALENGEVPSVAGARLALHDKKNTAAGKVVLTVPVAPEKYELMELSSEQYERELKEIAEELC